MADTEPVVPEVTTDDLAAALDRGAYLLDVRRDDEYEAVHVPGAVHIPLDQLEQRWQEIPDDRRIHVICASGMRSLAAAKALTTAGLEAVNVAGGTNAWVDEGRPAASGRDPG